jgi:hypothetical protein
MALSSAQRDSKLIELKARNEGTLNILERNLLKALEKRQFTTPESRERIEKDIEVAIEEEKAGL